VTNALAIIESNPPTNVNGQLSNGTATMTNRKLLTISNQTKFALLIASPKIYNLNEGSNSIKQPTVNGQVKNEITSPHSSRGNDEHVEVKKEKKDDETDDEDESLLSRLISYLTE
jgi:hypothetical protein